MTDRESTGNLEVRKRRIRFRAWHRGMREMDLILGRFADATLSRLDAREVDTFEALMEVPDPELYEWITGAKETPAEYETALMQELRSFHLGGSEHVR
jgi:antitoxin CptB